MLFKISTRTTYARRQCRVCVTVCFSFPFPSPKESKGFPRVVLMASLMVFPAVILSTATTRQSTSAMAGCLYQRLLFMLMLVMVTTGGAGQDTGSSTVIRILAVFDQSEMETMERVTHKTLIALNKEKTAWTGSSGGGRWNRCPDALL